VWFVGQRRPRCPLSTLRKFPRRWAAARGGRDAVCHQNAVSLLFYGASLHNTALFPQWTPLFPPCHPQLSHLECVPHLHSKIGTILFCPHSHHSPHEPQQRSGPVGRGATLFCWRIRKNRGGCAATHRDTSVRTSRWRLRMGLHRLRLRHKCPYVGSK
jgi:hypothetical protein